MMSTYDNKKAPNAHEKITGKDIPPRRLGSGALKYSLLASTKSDPPLAADVILTFTTLMGLSPGN
jgi:hypothetical protein